MNETETPRTEAQWGKNWATAMQRSYAMRDQCNQLERELNEAIKQRDALAVALRELRESHMKASRALMQDMTAIKHLVTEINKPTEEGEF